MSWDFLFGFCNALALAGWLLLAALPRGPKLMSVVMFGCVAMLCLAYAVLLVVMLSKGAGGGPGAALTSIAGIRGLFASDGGIVAGWIHYLAFDLFVGLWIARDADNKGFSRLVQLPFLILTCLAGPAGLLAWLVTRERRARRVARAA